MANLKKEKEEYYFENQNLTNKQEELEKKIETMTTEQANLEKKTAEEVAAVTKTYESTQA